MRKFTITVITIKILVIIKRIMVIIIKIDYITGYIRCKKLGAMEVNLSP